MSMRIAVVGVEGSGKTVLLTTWATRQNNSLNAELLFVPKNSQVLKDSKNKIELAKLKKDANLNIEIVGFVDEDTKIINDFADTLETGEINDDIVFDSLEAVTLFIKNSVKDAIKYPHKYADKKVLLNQLYNQQQEFELAEQETYIPKNDFDNYYYQ